jgi:hypothetical protein
MRQTRKPILTIFASIAGVVSGLHAACAQEASAPSEYQFFVTPYLWLASVHATTLTPLDRAPQVNSNVSTIDLLSKLKGAPFMGSFESSLRKLGLFCRCHPPAGRQQHQDAQHLFSGGPR